MSSSLRVYHSPSLPSGKRENADLQRAIVFIIFKEVALYAAVREQKVRKVIIWLARFGFSTRLVLTKMLGTSYNGQNEFFKRLIDDGLVERRYVTGTSKQLFTLTSAGVNLYKIIEPNLSIKRVPKISLPTLIHSMTIQEFVISNNAAESVVGEYELYKQDWLRRPDAVITNTKGTKIAIEVELTKKSSARVIYNFCNHFEDFKKGFFDRVLYLFPDDGIQKFYQDIYSDTSWPHVVYDEKKRSYKKISGSQFDPNEIHESEIFIFNRFSPSTL